MLVVLALFTGVIIGLLLTLFGQPVVGIAAAVVVVAAGIAAQRSSGPPRKAIGLLLLLAFVAGGGFLVVTALDLFDTVTVTEGDADTADAAMLQSAEDKLLALEGVGAFRLELTEPELQAVIQNGVAANEDLPIRRLDIDLRGQTSDVAFRATFKSGPVPATGTATITLVDGEVDVDVGTLDFGPVSVPALAADTVQSVLGAVTDLNAALADQQTVIQSIDVGADVLVVIGVRQGEPLTGGELLDAIRDQAQVATDAVVAPPEVLGPGRVNSDTEPGEPVVLALGDSIAAGVGVDQPSAGVVSRFHAAVERLDQSTYGLANLARSGETSTTLLTGGQLDAGVQVLQTQAVRYAVIDIGANDLLGHLQSADCSADLRAVQCQDRIERTLTSYRANLTTAFDRLVEANQSGAELVFLQTYNPFSLGLGESDQERESGAILSRLNGVAAELATARGIIVADGFTPMQRTTAATTHMLDDVPDIHPNGRGHDVLANVLFSAVSS